MEDTGVLILVVIFAYLTLAGIAFPLAPISGFENATGDLCNCGFKQALQRINERIGVCNL